MQIVKTNRKNSFILIKLWRNDHNHKDTPNGIRAWGFALFDTVTVLSLNVCFLSLADNSRPKKAPQLPTALYLSSPPLPLSLQLLASLPGIVEQIIMSSSDRSPVRRIGINNSPISSSITYLSGTSMKTVDSVHKWMKIKMRKMQNWSVSIRLYGRDT